MKKLVMGGPYKPKEDGKVLKKGTIVKKEE